jgi:hypothetical protein
MVVCAYLRATYDVKSFDIKLYNDGYSFVSLLNRNSMTN